MLMRIWTHRNPLANPANTCARLWRCMYSRTEPTTPDMIMTKQRIHSELNASMCMKCKKYSNATMPPIPAACALIFHLRLMISDTSVVVATPNIKPVSHVGA